MTKPDAQLQALIESAANGTLTEGEAKALAALMVHDPDARASYLEAMRLEAMLHEEFPATVDLALAPQALGPSSSRSRPRVLLWLAAAAAGLALGLGLWHLSSAPNGDETGESLSEYVRQSQASLPVATVTHAENVHSPTPYAVGMRVATGLVSLDSGTLQLTFDCGAVVTLRGPAVLQVESDYRGFLESGVLTARVPPQAQGFLITTPSSKLKDLGTEFAVSVSTGGVTDLHVLEGAVEASANGPGGNHAPLRIEENKAIRITNERIEPLAFSPLKFSPFPEHPLLPSPPFTHWDFDSLAGSISPDRSGKWPVSLVLGPDATPNQAPSAVAGKFGKALGFNGENEFGVTEHPGVDGSNPRTVAFWLKLPRQPTIRHGRPDLPNAIVAWGEPFEASLKWQIAWNASPTNGTVGAIRQEFGKGFVIGSTDLRDDQWHHIAAVFHGGEHADVATHVKLYVDGRLESMTGRQQQDIKTSTSKASAKANPVSVGRYLGKWSKYPHFYLEGALDELFLIEGALSQSEIVKLMETNSLHR